MPVNDNDSRVKRTKKLLRQGIAELGKNKSINKITVKELTDLVEINRGTFYLHYKDVYDLVDSIETELYNEFDKVVLSVTPDDILHRPIEILEAFFEYFKKHSDILHILMGENGDAKFVYRFGELTNAKTLELFKGVFPEMSMEKYNFAYNYTKFGFVGIINCWLTEYSHLTARQIAEKALALSLGGIWGIVGENGKEVLINAHNSNKTIHS